MRYLALIPAALAAAAFVVALCCVAAHLLTDAVGPLTCTRCGRQVRYGRAGCPCRYGRAARGPR